MTPPRLTLVGSAAPGTPPDSTTDSTTEDACVREIAAAVIEFEDGRLTRARQRLLAVWDRLDPHDAVGRCATAYWLACTQSGAEGQLSWAERALDDGENLLSRQRLFPGTALSIAAMYPRLHVEAARACLRLGSACGVLEHLASARGRLAELPEGAVRRRTVAEIAQVDADLGRADGGAFGRDLEEGDDDGWVRQSWDSRDGFWSDEPYG